MPKREPGDHQALSYGIQAVAKRTGISQDVLRAWERRYGAVKPGRGAGGRRMYTEEDIVRFQLVRRALALGSRIGEVARLDMESLQRLVQVDPGAAAVRGAIPRAGADDGAVEVDDEDVRRRLDLAYSATAALDAASLEAILEEAAVALPRPALYNRFFVPFMHRLGDRWRQGEIRASHEHLASAVVRTFLSTLRDGVSTNEGAPCIVVSTPAGETHEFGAYLAALSAEAVGWSCTFLGPNLPAEDIVAAARQRQARAVALSVTSDAVSRRVREQVLRVRRGLYERVALLVGGRGAASLDLPSGDGIIVLDDVASLGQVLESLVADTGLDQEVEP